jgi:hypothetical protein
MSFLLVGSIVYSQMFMYQHIILFNIYNYFYCGLLVYLRLVVLLLFFLCGRYSVLYITDRSMYLHPIGKQLKTTVKT